MLTDEEREALVKYRLEKAEETLVEARDCAKMGHWTLAANRLYYAAYYASSALLIQKGIVAKSHEGVIGMIGQKFVVTEGSFERRGKALGSSSEYAQDRRL